MVINCAAEIRENRNRCFEKAYEDCGQRGFQAPSAETERAVRDGGSFLHVFF